MPKSKHPLTPLELEIMNVLWETGPANVQTVQQKLGRPLAYTTVLTILRTLEGKGYVSRAPEGRGHRYFAAVKQTAAQKSALRHLTRKLFKGSAELLFVHLVSDQRLSEKQIRNMRKLLEGKSDTGET